MRGRCTLRAREHATTRSNWVTSREDLLHEEYERDSDSTPAGRRRGFALAGISLVQIELKFRSIVRTLPVLRDFEGTPGQEYTYRRSACLRDCQSFRVVPNTRKRGALNCSFFPLRVRHRAPTLLARSKVRALPRDFGNGKRGMPFLLFSFLFDSFLATGISNFEK